MSNFKDLTRQQFGKLVVLYRCGTSPEGTVRWKCRCICGNETIVDGKLLRTGRTKSCGCLQKETTSEKAHDLTGKTFGRLLVLRKTDERSIDRCVIWECQCACGQITKVRSKDLLSESIRSCGCLKIDSATKHGGRNTRLYTIWRDMKSRCYNPNNIGYKYYGGRGISICSEWKNSFETFRDWALANGYQDDLTIDRKNNDGNYTQSNCRWSTYKEQANNRR